MAPKRPSHLDDPPVASSSEAEEDSSSEEEEDEGASEEVEQESQKPRITPLSKPTPISSARPSAKRPSNSEVKDSKRAKKKGSEPDGGSAMAEDELKKSGDESKKLFQRLWSEDDEIVILKGMMDYAAKKGANPSAADMNAFHDFIKKSLQIDFTKTQLSDKVRRLKKKYENNAGRKKYNPTKPHEKEVFELSKKIWAGGEKVVVKAEQPKANGTGLAKVYKMVASPQNLSSPSSRPPEDLLSSPKLGALGDLLSSPSLGSHGISEHVLNKGLELISELKRAELEAKWKKIHMAEIELFAKRSQLLADQSTLILEALKSADH
ncbi:GLABROUS1 enhancer-binding protein-like [Humulus lupulus]|uniref:GLABROUS1 enhancer-binding protein-like n=1 Tax=Humulus lupulus TaxID=3486 RepID=UPI002B40FB5C|nr:GLABROUS1 enhancer-binding protein-like [Humulus lupulus]